MKQKPPKKQKPTSTKGKQSLERELEDAKLQAAMYARMIELAEEKYKINIRKNSDTK